MSEHNRKLRAWLIGGAAFFAAMSVAGCSSMRSMVGLADEREETRQPQFEASTAPMTSVASSEKPVESVPAEANRPAALNPCNAAF